MVQKAKPQRMCVGCREMKDKKSLIRVVKTPQGEVLIDATGKLPGRGAYICQDEACLQQAIKSKGLERAFKMAISQEIKESLQARLAALPKAEADLSGDVGD